MTETPTEGGSQTKNVRIAVLLVLAAVALLAGAVVWVGGVDGVADLLGFGEPDPVAEIPPKPEVPDADPAEEPDAEAEDPEASDEETETVDPADADPAEDPDAPATTPGTAPQTAGTGATPAAAATAPTAAQTAMYTQQLQSQANLARLANNEVRQLTIGTASTWGNRSSVPVTVAFRDGGSLSGTMVLTRTDNKWYFSSITAAGREPSATTPKRNIDPAVVKTIADQQATSANQDLITRGIIQRGFTTARVDGVTQGANTATVNVTLQGGSLDRRAARFVMISEQDSGRKHWFITRFELK